MPQHRIHHRQRPVPGEPSPWLADRLDAGTFGLGGHDEPDDTPADPMRRALVIRDVLVLAGTIEHSKRLEREVSAS